MHVAQGGHAPAAGESGVKALLCLPALCAGLLLTIPAPVAGQVSPSWTEVVLPGGRAGLPSALGLRPDLPRALVVGAIIRIVHADHDPGSPARVALAAYRAALPDEGDERVPIPLAPDVWQQELLSRPVRDRDLLGAILADRHLSLLCYGLLGLDGETLAWIEARPDLLRRIRDDYAGVFAAFGSAATIRAGALVLPGGEPMAPVWESLGVPPDPGEGLQALLRIGEGRLAYLAATLDGADPARMQFLIGDTSLPHARREHLVRAVYGTFRTVDPRRRVNDFPFSRPAWDSALLATSISVNAYGHLAGTRGFWQAVIEGREADPRSAPDLGAPDAGWLLGLIAPMHRQEREERFQTLFYVQRQHARHPETAWEELGALARAFRHYPALMLTFERMGLSDSALRISAAERAGTLAGGTGAAADDVALALFQAPLALLDALVRRGGLELPAAAPLLQRLIAIAPGPEQARRVTAWFETGLLPAIGHDPAMGIPRESLLLEALAGFNAQLPESSRSPIEWEGQPYRIDPAAPELVRLSEIRSRQGGNTLDAVLGLAGIGAALASASTLDDVRDAETRLAALRDALRPIQVSEIPGMPAPPSVPGVVGAALEDLSNVRLPRDLEHARAVAGRLAPLEAAMTADVLSSLVYALALGPADGRLFLAGNVARRHDYGLRERNAPDRARTPWLVPRESSGAGSPWHVRGSLLALDAGLAHLQMRQTRLDLPDGRPSFSEMDRRALTSTLVFMNPLAPDAAGARLLVEWLQAGRRLVEGSLTPSAVDAIAGQLDVGPRRRAALAWAAVEDPGTVADLFLLAEIALLGRPANAPAPPAAWGSGQTPFTGCLCPALPAPPALHRFAGRPAGGLLPTRAPELVLAVLEALFELDLPASLAHGVLEGAIYDFFHEAQLAHPDDWWSYSMQARTIPRERFIDYIAALAAGGPLVPAAAPAGSRP